MYIEELNEDNVTTESLDNHVLGDPGKNALVVSHTKRALVGAGARALFYPTLLYNVVRNKIQSEFRWWDRVDEFVLLGAVPFPTDVPRLKALGVGGVVTLNEPYETLVPTSLYYEHGIEHLVIPTRDYLFAPSQGDIRRAVEFIHGNALCGKTTYIHCKAGRGRSTTIVLCYLVKHKEMTPESAYVYVRSIRPRVLLASAQWQAVQDYHNGLRKDKTGACKDKLPKATATLFYSSKVIKVEEGDEFDDDDDSSLVLVTESDLDGYEEDDDYIAVCKNTSSESNLACRVQFASQAAMSRLSCLWLRSHNEQKALRNNSKRQSSFSSSSSSNGSDMGVEIHVFEGESLCLLAV